MPTTPESYIRPLQQGQQPRRSSPMPLPQQREFPGNAQPSAQGMQHGRPFGQFQLPQPQAPQPLNLPPPPPGLGQMQAPQVPQMPNVPFNQMPAFQGFPGPFPGDNPINPNLSPQERTLARLETLNLPPSVIERIRNTLTGVSNQPPVPPAQPGSLTPPVTRPRTTRPSRGDPFANADFSNRGGGSG